MEYCFKKLSVRNPNNLLQKCLLYKKIKGHARVKGQCHEKSCSSEAFGRYGSLDSLTIDRTWVLHFSDIIFSYQFLCLYVKRVSDFQKLLQSADEFSVLLLQAAAC